MGERRRHTGTFEVERTTGSHDVLDRLFVYGTMRQGQTARSLIANQITRSVSAQTTGALYAFPMGGPGFTEVPAAGGSGVVIGEVVWLTELPATFGLLDAYEGQDFARVIKQVTLATGEQVWTWMYTLSDPAAVKHGILIEDGNWVRYWTEHQ
ncbi:MAG: hypothetical protein JWP01_3468 [Myxococcales bacterium]|nr:hypothetical protein [Myxococcales bacterium]